MSESSQLMSPPPLPPFAAVHLAAAGYLARYSGRTRDAYTLDLKTFFAWCAERNTEVFAMTRPHLEIYVRWMEEQRGYAPATTARRLSTVAGFYRFAVIDGYLDRSPAEYVRRPHVPEESQALALDRMQLGALVSAARASSPDDAALITMLVPVARTLDLATAEPGETSFARLSYERTQLRPKNARPSVEMIDSPCTHS